MEKVEENLKKWIKKMESLKQDADLSMDEDLSIALMHLVSMEEHFYFTAMKNEDQNYLDFMLNIRELRKKLMKKIVKTPSGEEWCISKHLLGCSMRLYEVGCKVLSLQGPEEANKLFAPAFDLWTLFFAINLKMIEPKNLDKNLLKNQSKEMNRFSNLIKKVIDCCKEW